jgi:hypothetical protein
MALIRFIMVCAAVMLSFMTADAQLRMVSKEKLQEVANPALSADSASLSFEQKHIIAEPMNEDDAPTTFAYRFTNVGKEAVAIKRLVSTCSCASAVCPVKEVAPGASAEISVVYNPKGHPGKFERKIFVYTQDGNAPAAVLKLSVEVATGVDLSREWPVQMGSIRLRRSEVAFSAGAKGVEQLRFINISGRPLTLQCEEPFLPDCLSFRTEPAVVEDGAEGVIVISYDPSLPGARESVNVILKGLGLPPTKSSITVRIK